MRSSKQPFDDAQVYRVPSKHPRLQHSLDSEVFFLPEKNNLDKVNLINANYRQSPFHPHYQILEVLGCHVASLFVSKQQHHQHFTFRSTNSRNRHFLHNIVQIKCTPHHQFIQIDCSMLYHFHLSIY
ncbi:unnamed protein product [Ilex paraguariensis]|uniref:Uncharacterized protein n=1 Tax=Ilex paraguariensis TaxID=185542 RepID=A0ABC8QUH5_9AQUA